MFQFSVLLPTVLVLVAVIALAAIYFGVRNVIRPLQALSQVANRIAFGDYQAAQKQVGGVREIEELRETLDAMANQVHTAQDAMQNYIVAITRGQEVRVTIQDNGIGFDAPEAPTTFAQAGHFGLTGMQERAQLFAGSVYVKSERDKGTEVIAFVPIKGLENEN